MGWRSLTLTVDVLNLHFVGSQFYLLFSVPPFYYVTLLRTWVMFYDCRINMWCINACAVILIIHNWSVVEVGFIFCVHANLKFISASLSSNSSYTTTQGTSHLSISFKLGITLYRWVENALLFGEIYHLYFIIAISSQNKL